MTESSYQDVLARVREYITCHEQFDIWRPRWDLAGETPGSRPNGWELAQAYCRQVLRAVDELTGEGLLVKTGRGRDAQYWTPAAWKACVAAMQQAVQADDRRRESWRQVRARLAALGITETGDQPARVTLSPEDWDALLTRAERPQLPDSPAGQREQEITA